MANYTMELRQVMEITPLFDFEYPIYNESYRAIFEGKFINHFYFREIGVETIARFKHNLRSQLNLLMPIYNKMYNAVNLEQRILDNYEVLESFEKTVNGDRTNINDGVNKGLFSDTGRKRVDINDVDYVSNINKEIINITSNTNENNIEKWERKMSGNIGVQTDAEAVTVFIKNLHNIDLLIFEELDNLFMQVW